MSAEQRAAEADPLEQRRAKVSEISVPTGVPIRPSPSAPFADAHRVLDVGQAREDVAHAERIDGKRRKDPVLRGQVEAESASGKLVENVCREL